MPLPVAALAKLNQLSSDIMARLLRDLPSTIARIDDAKAAMERAEEAASYARTAAGVLEYSRREVRKQWRDGWQTAGRAVLRAGRFVLLLAAFHFWSRAEYALAVVTALSFISLEYEHGKNVMDETRETAIAEAARVAAASDEARLELSRRIEDLVVLTTAIANEHEAMLKALEKPTTPEQ